MSEKEPKMQEPEETTDSAELSDEELEGMAGGLGFPDVCKTPAPGGPIAIPYPNTTLAGDTGAKKVKIERKEILSPSSKISRSSGDEPGAAGGVVDASALPFINKKNIIG